MPEVDPPQQQQPMEVPALEGVVITRQPVSHPIQQDKTRLSRFAANICLTDSHKTSEPQMEMGLRGGFEEECGCCGCEESCSCCGSDEHEGPHGGGPPGGGPEFGGPGGGGGGFGGPGGPHGP
ncbi:hypothetical protein N8I77_001289 [Diaporthe amygdali]|uniref:Uncharacterized protein n=1 Tax=Phomopsis amygdali TaxID=1214568 RepID=A0AAD9SNU2_PHOAM|nr:hypothetical protein N8I77_001289 [Diaporthe amygdali]